MVGAAGATTVMMVAGSPLLSQTAATNAHATAAVGAGMSSVMVHAPALRSLSGPLSAMPVVVSMGRLTSWLPCCGSVTLKVQLAGSAAGGTP